MKNQYVKVIDNRGAPIRGLWKRGKHFYAQINIPTGDGKTKQTKRRLKGCKYVSQAKDALADLHREIKSGDFETPVASQTLADFREYYLANTHKAATTMRGEAYFLKDWVGYLGEEIKVAEIRPSHILSYRTHQLSEGLSPRTVNLRVVALNNLFKMAKSQNIITELPTRDIVQLKYAAKVKQLLEPMQIEKVIATAIAECPKSGRMFSEYLRLLTYTGMRETECLSLKWPDIDFEKQVLTIRAELTKNKHARHIPFNPQLKKHLRQMKKKRKDEGWLFPSPRPNKQGGRIMNFKTTLAKATKKSGVYLSYHLLRHYFVSKAVMAGVDYMTIAKIVGHTDGGILIGKVYGHLHDKHVQEQMQRIIL